MCFCSLNLQPCDLLRFIRSEIARIWRWKPSFFQSPTWKTASWVFVPASGTEIERNKNVFHVKKGNALIRVKENRNNAGTNRKMYEHAIEQGEVHIFTEKMWWLWWDGRKEFERYLKLRHLRTGKDFVHRCLFALFQNRGQFRAQHADRATFAWRRFWDACASIYKYI